MRVDPSSSGSESVKSLKSVVRNMGREFPAEMFAVAVADCRDL